MLSNTPNSSIPREIYTVSQLNSEVRAVLQGSFPLLWVEGEISNLARPASGHIYFTLKDPQAQVRCAMFRMKRQYLRFQPENGQRVLLRGRVGLYESRGEFQLVTEHMEPAGEGALRQAFEALKLKLQDEGLFDTAHKKPLPLLPRRIGIITSPSGAAIRDVLSVLGRRFPGIPVLIYPAAVQGEEAPQSLVNALRLAERRADCDLLILTRGGGSLEDLMAFNDEALARTLHDLSIPVISAVGHEIDFTIADLVADRRAPTPSVAAELAAPERDEIGQQIQALQRRARRCLVQQIAQGTQALQALRRQLQSRHPSAQLQQRQQYLDELGQRLQRSQHDQQGQRRARCSLLASRLRAATPAHRLQQRKDYFKNVSRRLQQQVGTTLQRGHQRLALSSSRLNTLSPLATLERGYSITLKQPDGRVLRDSTGLGPGDTLETRLSSAIILSTVTQVKNHK